MDRFPVVIAGGGPVGLTLACTLSRLGTPCLLAERAPEPTRHPKMDITNARGMELFRRLGLEEALRAVAVPQSHNFDVAWITTLAGHELHRFAYPSPDDWRRQIAARNDGSQPQVPPMRVSQVRIEPVLRQAVADAPNVTALFGWAFEELRCLADGVEVTLRDAETGATRTVRSDYLVGCDGANSRVRRQLGIPLEGPGALPRRFMVHIRSDARHLLERFGIAWHYQSLFGTIIAQDGREIWTLQSEPHVDHATSGTDPRERLRRFIGSTGGADIDCDILVSNPWVPSLAVAASYRRGRVLLAGDAAHQYNPTGGYGMNTGVADAVGLGWQLAAVAQGFGGPALLAAYDVERRPVGVRNRDASGRHTRVRRRIAEEYRAAGDIFGSDDAAAACRRELATRIAAIGNAENESWGIELGYAYRGSPVVASETDSENSQDPLLYMPTTAPGARAPSVQLADGSMLYDRLGPWFTLLCFGQPPSSAWGQAAARLGVPVTILQIDEPRLRPIYQAPLVLVRPDHHVAWRGRDGADPAKVLAHALGWETFS